jgi:hypothetical protein
MYSYSDMLAKAKSDNTYTKEEWFKIFQILLGINETNFNADWDFDLQSFYKK